MAYLGLLRDESERIHRGHMLEVVPTMGATSRSCKDKALGKVVPHYASTRDVAL